MTGPAEFRTFVAARGASLVAAAQRLTGTTTEARRLVVEALADAQRRWRRIRDDPEAFVQRRVAERWSRFSDRRDEALVMLGQPATGVADCDPLLPDVEASRRRRRRRSLVAAGTAAAILGVAALTWSPRPAEEALPQSVAPPPPTAPVVGFTPTSLPETLPGLQLVAQVSATLPEDLLTLSVGPLRPGSRLVVLCDTSQLLSARTSVQGETAAVPCDRNDLQAQWVALPDEGEHVVEIRYALAFEPVEVVTGAVHAGWYVRAAGID